jgi:hypothetical protein
MDTNDKTTLEVSEIWKFTAAIAISCVISFGGHWLSDTSKYTTVDDVEKIITVRQESFQVELKHNVESLRELKTVVENNSKVLNDIRIELAAMREERRLLLKHLSINVKNTD